MVGIWCVELVGEPPLERRWARREGQTLKFDTEEEAMAEVRKFRAKHARGRWLFFPSPIGTKIALIDARNREPSA